MKVRFFFGLFDSRGGGLGFAGINVDLNNPRIRVGDRITLPDWLPQQLGAGTLKSATIRQVHLVTDVEMRESGTLGVRLDGLVLGHSDSAEDLAHDFVILGIDYEMQDDTDPR